MPNDSIGAPSAGSADIDADVAIVGAGPAGIAAAVSAAKRTRRVVVLDEGIRPGGQIWRHRDRAGLPRLACEWLGRLDASRAVFSAGTAVVDTQRDADGRFMLLAERGGAPVRIRAESVVLATGARERFLPFPGWTRPGVVGAGGAQALLKSGVPVDGTRVVVAGTGPLLLAVAATLAHAGARVMLVAEQAPALRVARFAAGLWRSPVTLAQAARYRVALGRTQYRTGTWVERADGVARSHDANHPGAHDAPGTDAVASVTLRAGHRRWTVACDLLCVGYGLLPSTELARLLGCELDGGSVRVNENQETTIPGVYCAGETAGIAGVYCALAEGHIAGRAAGDRRGNVVRAAPGVGGDHDAGSTDHGASAARGRGGHGGVLIRARNSARAQGRAMDRAFALRDELRSLADASTVVCRCEDVVLGAIDSRWSARQAKLYTRVGMGPCQGRVCGGALQYLFGWEADTIRPPISSTRLTTLISSADDPAGSP
jgi:thioredoxin reductase